MLLRTKVLSVPRVAPSAPITMPWKSTSRGLIETKGFALMLVPVRVIGMEVDHPGTELIVLIIIEVVCIPGCT